jgi:ribosomal protein S18 acetylase RimI-like enzyme
VVTWRFATEEDIPRLARWNAELVEDERARTALDLDGFATRMRGFLAGAYRAVIFAEGETPVGYALYAPEPGGVHLRQLYVARALRGRGLGRAAVELLRREVFPPGAHVAVDVLAWNARALAFWRAAGFRDYSVRMEIGG